MDRSVQYAQVMSNFDSVYNTSPNSIHRQPHIFVPTSSFSSQPSQSISSSLSSSHAKFNLDLYQPNDPLTQFDLYQLSSPQSSVIVHHHPVYSPPPSQTVSKLRQINDELCHTLAQSELPNYPPPLPPQYHVHHHPISHRTYRSQSYSSSESEDIEPKKPTARITYKVHIPSRRKRQSQKPTPDVDQILVSTSDAYIQDDPVTVDVYPTRDQGYIRRIRNRPDNQQPWLPDEILVRRNSYSGQNTSRTPRATDYENQLLQPKSRLSDCKERVRSSSAKSRIRGGSAQNVLRHSATAPVWRPNGSIKHARFIGSNDPPSPPKPTREPPWNPSGTATKTKQLRAFDPTSKLVPAKQPEPVWHPPSKEIKKKIPRYFEPTTKSERTTPVKSATEPIVRKKPPKQIPSGDPTLKTRIATAESKVKSAWESTASASNPRPPAPRPTKSATITTPAKRAVKPAPARPITSSKKPVREPVVAVDTGRSSIFDAPPPPLFESTPRNQSPVRDEDLMDEIFGDTSQISVQSNKKHKVEPSTDPVKTPPKKSPSPKPEPGYTSDFEETENDKENDRDLQPVPNPSDSPRASPVLDDENEAHDKGDAAPSKGDDTIGNDDETAGINESHHHAEDDDDDDLKKKEDASSTSPKRKDPSPEPQEPSLDETNPLEDDSDVPTTSVPPPVPPLTTTSAPAEANDESSTSNPCVVAPQPAISAPVGRQPGLFGQMPATAGGIAVGSAVGHSIGAAITGGYHNHDQSAAVTQTTTGLTSQPLYQDLSERYGTGRCNLYQKEFMKCLDEANGDSKHCQGFWEALKECQRHQNSGQLAYL
ncbi:unnamed protein product [Adineta ricciae]|uniref:CHCH domain-containing protein n=1 Tax=Adineta ricciae TaxID=249248 RepID=A0A815I5A2_ADIRI|nr:unnamed protein product [Adineta ricciae]